MASHVQAVQQRDGARTAATPQPLIDRQAALNGDVELYSCRKSRLGESQQSGSGRATECTAAASRCHSN
jgi:hypothetical protein